VIQMRRFVGGWELVAAGGVGAQRDSGSDWRQANFLHARFRSPAASGWAIHGNLTFTNTPSLSASSGAGYSYVQGTLGVLRRF
jgi:hypothetical protein